MANFAEFLNDDAGAISVDWVALTGSVIILGVVVVFAVFNQGVGPAVLELNDALGDRVVEADKGSGIDCNNFNSC